jgi:predicted MFS family arabinose efflux permease
MSIYAAIANLANSGSTALLVVFLIRVAGFGPAATGLLMAATGVGGIAGAMAARRVAGKLGTARALLLSMLGSGLFPLLIPLTGPGPRATCYVVGSVMLGAGGTVGNIILVSFRQTYSPRPCSAGSPPASASWSMAPSRSAH